MLLWILECIYCFKLVFSFSSAISPGEELLGHMVVLVLGFWGRYCFAQWMHRLTSPPALVLLLLLLSRFSRARLCDPIDGSPPGSPVPGILQARTLEWVAISFSNAWRWKEKVKSLSCVRLLATPWTAAYQAPPSMGFSRREYWSGVPLPPPSAGAGGCLSPHPCQRLLFVVFLMAAIL